MEFSDALDFIEKEPIHKLVYRTAERITYAPAVDIVIKEALEDFDEEVYNSYVKKAKFRSDLLALRDDKKDVDEFSKADLQLFLKIQEKAEAIMGGQIAIILDNKIFIKVVRAILVL